jgi:2,3-dihydroxybenzoate decarboxylase
MNIALEEHFIVPCLADYLEKAMPKVSPTAHDKLLAELADFGEARIAAMDAGGVGLAVLSISGPGVQVEPDTAVAIKLAQQANDLLATEVQRRKDRYAGFAHLAMQDPVAAADELERSVRDLGLVGAMVNGHTNGIYLDDPRLRRPPRHFPQRSEDDSILHRYERSGRTHRNPPAHSCAFQRSAD